MKTSKKILFGLAILLLVFVIGSLFIIRQDLKETVANSNKTIKYQKLEKPFFSKINVEAGYRVKIYQSRDESLELEEGFRSDLLQMVGGELILKRANESKLVNVRINLPILEEIEAEGNSHVWLDGYNQDSLVVTIRDSVEFTSADNKIVHLEVQTFDAAKVVIIRDPME